MSITAWKYVWDHSKSKGNERLVMLAIADEANDEGTNAFPSIRRIAQKANCDKDTVIECIKRLEAMDELIVLRPKTHGRGKFNRYELPMKRSENPTIKRKNKRVGKPDHSRGVNGRMDRRKWSDLGGEKVGPIRTNPLDPYIDPSDPEEFEDVSAAIVQMRNKLRGEP